MAFLRASKKDIKKDESGETEALEDSSFLFKCFQREDEWFIVLLSPRALSILIVMGDIDLPSINWVDGCGQITSHPSYGADLNNSFLDLVNDIGSNQFVNIPTRNSNILDLVLSTSTSILDLTTTPGMSDHEAIVFYYTINNTNFNSKPDHKVALYHQANLHNIKGDLLELQSSFLTNDPYGKTVE